MENDLAILGLAASVIGLSGAVIATIKTALETQKIVRDLKNKHRELILTIDDKRIGIDLTSLETEDPKKIERAIRSVQAHNNKAKEMAI